MVFFNKISSKVLKIAFIMLFSVIYSQQKEYLEINKLIERYADNLYTNKDSAWFYIKEAEKKSLQVRDNFYLSRCLYNQGYYYLNYGEKVKANKLMLQALKLAYKSKNDKIVVKSYDRLALIQMDLGNFDQSSAYLFKGLRFSRIKKMPEQTLILITLGLLYGKQNDTLNSIKNYREAEKLLKENNDKQQLLYVYNNLANYQSKKNYELSVNYLKKALEIAYELDDKNSQFDALINISAAYVSANIYNKNIEYLIKAKEIATQLEDKTKLFHVYQHMGIYHQKTNNPEEALKMYQLALQNSHNKDFDQKLILYNSISEAYEKNDNYREALKYHKDYEQLKDSVFTIEKNKNFNEIVTKYEVEKKNDQIKLLNQQKEIEKKRRNTIIIVSVFIVLLLLSFAFFIFKGAQLQKKLRIQEEKTHKQETEKLIKDQELKETQALVVGQNEERNRIAKDLHDGIAGDIAGIKLILNQENKNIQNHNLDKIQNDLSVVFQEIRNISHNLSQNYTQNKMLRSLLQDLKSSYKQRSNINFEINIFPENATDNLEEIKKQHLYRVFQELLQNAFKYSNATEIELSINKNENDLNIIFEDNGVGFNMENFKGIGLKNIEERLKIIDAELTIDSHPGRGSAFIIDIKNT